MEGHPLDRLLPITFPSSRSRSLCPLHQRIAHFPRAGGIYWCKWVSFMMVLENCNVGDVLSSGPTPDERYLPLDTDFRFHSIRQSILFNM